MEWYMLIFMAALFCVTQSTTVTRNGIQYTIEKGKKNWDSAEKDCVAKGGHLASFHSQEEWDFVVAEAKKVNVQRFWIGLSDITTEGTFQWSDGTKVTFLKWSSGEPNNQRNEDCGMEWNNGFWNDGHCVNAEYYVCKVSSVIVKNGGLTYLIDRQKRSWQEAEDRCVSKGGHLASFHSQAEWDFVVAEAKKINIKHFWIGLNDITTENTFVWSDGTKVGYKRWSQGEPNNQKNEDCGMEWNNGFWNDGHCVNGEAYVCKFVSNSRGGYFYIGRHGKSWDDAQNYCRSLNGNLATIRNDEQNKLLNTLLDHRNLNAAWIGYNDKVKEGTFTWISGANKCYTDWCKGEPNDNGGREDCAQARWGKDGCWNDNICSNKYPFVCDFKL